MCYFCGKTYRRKKWRCLENTLRIWELSLQRQWGIRTSADYSAFSWSYSCHIKSSSRAPGSPAGFPWHWCRCVGLSVSRLREKQILHRHGFNHHLRIGLLPPHRGSRNTFGYHRGSLLFPSIYLGIKTWGKKETGPRY